MTTEQEEIVNKANDMHLTKEQIQEIRELHKRKQKQAIRSETIHKGYGNTNI